MTELMSHAHYGYTVPLIIQLVRVLAKYANSDLPRPRGLLYCIRKMNSKNLLISVLLVWASCATFIAVLRRSSYTPPCVYNAEEQLRKLNMLTDKENVEGGKQNSSASLVKNVSSQSRLTAELSQPSPVSHIHEIPNHLQKYVWEIFQPKINVELEGFTMIMLTYKRVKMLSQLLTHYCKVKKLKKILVVWNDVGSAIPRHVLELNNSCQTRLEFIQEKENKLTNRFKPRQQIETDCEFLVCSPAYYTYGINS